MRLRTLAARLGILRPSKERLEGLLRCLAEGLDNNDATAVDVLLRELPATATVHGFLVDVVCLVSPCLHSTNRTVVIAGLKAIRVIVIDYGDKLSAFSITRLLNDVLLFYRRERELCKEAEELFFKIVDVNHCHAFHQLKRLMAAGDEEVCLEILALVLDYVKTTWKLSRAVATECCQLAMEGFLHPSSATRVRAFDLVYALQYWGTPQDEVLAFFQKRSAPKELLHAIRVRLNRRYNPPMLSAWAAENYAASDPVFRWVLDTAVGSEHDLQMTSDVVAVDAVVFHGTAFPNESSSRRHVHHDVENVVVV